MVLRTQAAARWYSLKRSRVCQSWVISLPVLMEMKRFRGVTLIHQPSHLLNRLLWKSCHFYTIGMVKLNREATCYIDWF